MAHWDELRQMRRSEWRERLGFVVGIVGVVASPIVGAVLAFALGENVGLGALAGVSIALVAFVLTALVATVASEVKWLWNNRELRK